MDLYMVGVITWEEHAMLAFQPELHPDYDQTVGALTGEKADPDRPRDYVAIWEARLAFERKHNAGDANPRRAFAAHRQRTSPDRHPHRHRGLSRVASYLGVGQSGPHNSTGSV